MEGKQFLCKSMTWMLHKLLLLKSYWLELTKKAMPMLMECWQILYLTKTQRNFMKERRGRVGIWENRSLPQCMCRIFHKKDHVNYLKSQVIEAERNKVSKCSPSLQPMQLQLHQ